MRNVLIGDVWLCSGQSNMEWTVADSLNPQTELANANFPAIRLLRVPKALAHEPAADVNCAWKVCTRNTAMMFSGVAFFFGRHIHKETGVPIGLIDASWGGTIVETWTSMQALKTQPETQPIIDRYEEAMKDLPKARAIYAEQLAAWEKDCYWEDPGNQGEGKGWAAADFDDSAWPTMNLPTTWKPPA